MPRSMQLTRRASTPARAVANRAVSTRLTGAGAIRGGVSVGRALPEAQRRAATGVKRYGAGASSAATYGRVDPAGYRQRQMNNALKQQAAQRYLQMNGR